MTESRQLFFIKNPDLKMFDCLTALHSERLPCFSKINRMLMVTNINTKNQNQSLVH